jgi:uncharacterized protein
VSFPDNFSFNLKADSPSNNKMQQASEQIIVFTRWPVPGRVKTRLIPALGIQGAAELHRRLTEHTVRQVAHFRQQRPEVGLEIRFTGGSREQLQNWLPAGQPAEQAEGDLGTRLSRAFADAFGRGLRRVVAVGSDCPDLSPSILAEAFARLHDHDLILGPAVDGGYYLIGLRQDAAEIFNEIPWGTAAVFEETLKRAAARAFSISLLETLVDVDRPEDLAHFGDYTDLG